MLTLIKYKTLDQKNTYIRHGFKTLLKRINLLTKGGN